MGWWYEREGKELKGGEEIRGRFGGGGGGGGRGFEGRKGGIKEYKGERKKKKNNILMIIWVLK